MFAWVKGASEGEATVHIQIFTPFKSPCTTPWPCIYINPLAMSLSLALEGVVNIRCGHWWEELTSSNRSTFRLSSMNSLIFPLSIHSETIAKLRWPIITPNSGSTFGWRRDFQVTTSLQNLYHDKHQLTDKCSSTNYGTHPHDLPGVTTGKNPQPLDGNITTIVFAFPDISKPPLIQWFIRPVVAQWWDFGGPWDQA